jgi:chromosome segregation ATPase
VLTESSKKSVKDLEERLKANQLKLIENESQTESLRNQADKLKRQFESINKELVDTKNQLK